MGNNEVNSIGPVKTYNILWQHQREENRLLSERTNIFLAASSILFLAFVMLFQESIISISGIKWLRIVLSIAGMCITVIFFILARGTVKALEFLWGKQEHLEKDFPEFSFMRENGCAPQIDRKAREKRESKLVRFIGKHASEWLIPSTFCSLWVVSLIFAIIS